MSAMGGPFLGGFTTTQSGGILHKPPTWKYPDMISAETRELLQRNLRAVEARMAAACARAGRTRADVTLVAVTKYVSPEIAALLPELGLFDLGESRPQELWRKAAALPKEVRWHLIGHLQRNKVEKTLPLVHRIHAVDSV